MPLVVSQLRRPCSELEISAYGARNSESRKIMPDVQKPRAPGGLDVAGRRLWKAVISDADSQEIALDSREIAWLEDACRLTDRLERLEVELEAAGTYMSIGVAKQPVAH